MLGQISRSGAPLASLAAFFSLVVAVFAIIGMMLFGQQLSGLAAGTSPVLQQYNFNNFPGAWLTVFQISSADQWMSITWSVMQLSWVGFLTQACEKLSRRSYSWPGSLLCHAGAGVTAAGR